MGRPSTYTDVIAQEICDRLSLGESLIEICSDEHMPGETTVYRWLRDDAHKEGFWQDYARAREAQADHSADEMKLIADDGRNDWMERHGKDGESLGWIVNGEAVRRSDLRWRDRQWRAGQQRPKKWGAATLLKHADADGNNLDLAAAMSAARDRAKG